MSDIFRSFSLMKKTDKFISLVIALLMMAAAVTVNKILFGHNIQRSETVVTENEDPQDPLTVSDAKTVIHV